MMETTCVVTDGYVDRFGQGQSGVNFKFTGTDGTAINVRPVQLSRRREEKIQDSTPALLFFTSSPDSFKFLMFMEACTFFILGQNYRRAIMIVTKKMT